MSIPTTITRIQYPDNKKFNKIINIFLDSGNNTLFMSAYMDISGNEFVKDNIDKPFNNRIIKSSVYMPSYLDEKIGEYTNGYLTLKFANNSTCTIIDNIDNNWYNKRYCSNK